MCKEAGNASFENIKTIIMKLRKNKEINVKMRVNFLVFLKEKTLKEWLEIFEKKIRVFIRDALSLPYRYTWWGECIHPDIQKKVLETIESQKNRDKERRNTANPPENTEKLITYTWRIIGQS